MIMAIPYPQEDNRTSMQRLITITIAVVLLFVALPVHAQDGRSHTIAMDGFSFTYDAAFGTQVHIRQYPGDPVNAEIPGSSEPPFTEFDVFTVGVGEAGGSPWLFEAPLGVRVYRTVDIAPYQFSQPQVDQLAALLAERPDLSVYMDSASITQQTLLPFLPNPPALQAIRGQAHYVDLPTLSGIAFITTYRQSAEPFNGSEFFYTFQGLSADGQYYVSALVQLDTTLFPNELPADFNYDAWMADINTYYAETQATLNNAAPSDFTPSLDVADAVFARFTFGS
jgi:hypothetical protein